MSIEELRCRVAEFLATHHPREAERGVPRQHLTGFRQPLRKRT